MKLRVTGHRVLVKPEKVSNKTDSGIYIPDQTVHMEQAGIDKGVVVMLGNTAYMDERLGNKPWCKVGDVVVWPRYAGRPYPAETAEYMVVNDEDILLVVEEE